MIGALLPDLWPYLLGAVALLAGLFGLRRAGVREGRQGEALRAAEAEAKRRFAAEDAERRARMKAEQAIRGGESPEDIVRRNDGAWGP